MGINIAQTGRTATSVTFDVYGIVNDRGTYIWIPFAPTPAWYSLVDANAAYYIASYSVTDPKNGSITVYFYETDTAEYKVWDFQVGNFVDGTPNAWSLVLDTIIKFEWDGAAATKYTGDNMDITTNDFYKLNYFTAYIYWWIGNTNNSFITVDTTAIHAADLAAMAQKIYYTANGLSSTTLPFRTFILAWVNDILTYVTSGADCKAKYFNDIYSAINSFNLSV